MIQKRNRPKLTTKTLASGVTTEEQEVSMAVKATAGKLYCVDLAGSERAKKSGARGSRMEELKAINMSLSALGNCISALAEVSGGKSAHIPYRDSRLTRLLQDSLGGNAKTTLIVTIGPSVEHLTETLNTLQFGQRAMRVVMHAKINQEIDYKSLAIQLQSELDTKDDIIHHLENQLKIKTEIIVRHGLDPNMKIPSIPEEKKPAGIAKAELTKLQADHSKEVARLKSMLNEDAAQHEAAMEEEIDRITIKYEKQIAEEKSENGSLQDRLAQTEDELLNAQGKVGQKLLDLERDKAASREEVARLESELKAVESEKVERLSELHQERDDLSSKLEEASRELQQALANHAEISTQMLDSSGERSELRQQMLALKEEARESKERLDTALDLNSGHDLKSAEREESHQLELLTLSEKLTKAQGEVQEVQIKLSSKQSEANQAEAKRAEAEEGRKTTQSKLDEAISEVQLQKKEGQVAVAEAKGTASERDEAMRQRDVSQKELIKLQEALAAEKAKSTSAGLDLTSLESASKLKDDEATQLRSDMLASTAKADELTRKLKFAQEVETSLEAKVSALEESLKGEIALKEGAYASLNQATSIAKEELAASKAMFVDVEKKRASLERSLEEALAAKEASEKSLAASQAETSEKSSAFQDVTESLVQKQAEVEKLLTELKRGSSEQEGLLTRVSGLEADLETERDANAELSSQAGVLVREKETSSKKAEQVTASLEALKLQHSDLNKEQSRLAAELTGSQESLTNLHQQIESQTEDSNRSGNELKGEVSMVRAELASRDQDLVQAKAELAKLDAETARLTSLKESSSQACADLQDKLEALGEEASQAHAEVVTLENKLDSIASKLEETIAQRDAEGKAKQSAERSLQESRESASAATAASGERVAGLEKELAVATGSLKELEAIKAQSILEFRDMQGVLEETKEELCRTHETLEAEVEAGVVNKTKHGESASAKDKAHEAKLEEVSKEREMLKGQAAELVETLSAKEEAAVEVSQALAMANGESRSLGREVERLNRLQNEAEQALSEAHQTNKAHEASLKHHAEGWAALSGTSSNRTHMSI